MSGIYRFEESDEGFDVYVRGKCIGDIYQRMPKSIKGDGYQITKDNVIEKQDSNQKLDR